MLLPPLECVRNRPIWQDDYTDQAAAARADLARSVVYANLDSPDRMPTNFSNSRWLILNFYIWRLENDPIHACWTNGYFNRGGGGVRAGRSCRRRTATK